MIIFVILVLWGVASDLNSALFMGFKFYDLPPICYGYDLLKRLSSVSIASLAVSILGQYGVIGNILTVI